MNWPHGSSFPKNCLPPSSGTRNADTKDAERYRFTDQSKMRSTS